MFKILISLLFVLLLGNTDVVSAGDTKSVSRPGVDDPNTAPTSQSSSKAGYSPMVDKSVPAPGVDRPSPTPKPKSKKAKKKKTSASTGNSAGKAATSY